MRISFQELQELPRQKGRMFLNGLYTDCARNVPKGPESSIHLDLTDFNQNEIRTFFRTCFVDPGRKNAYTAHYGNEQLRSLSTTQYYHTSGAPERANHEDVSKTHQGIKLLETNIPTPKTAALANYIAHLTYMMTHLNRLFDYYNFRKAKITWAKL